MNRLQLYGWNEELFRQKQNSNYEDFLHSRVTVTHKTCCKISKKEYADKVNELCAALTSRYMEVLYSENKNILFGENRENINTTIIDVNMMPESFEPVKASLKL